MKAIVMVRNGSAMPGPDCLLTQPREGSPEMDDCMREFWVWRDKKRWVCVCSSLRVDPLVRTPPPSEKAFSSCLLRDGRVGDVSCPCSFMVKGERLCFCWCLCLIAGCKNYKFSLAETFLNKRFLLSQLLSFRLCTPTPTAAVAQGHLGF